MKIRDLTETGDDDLVEAKMVWAKKGSKLTKKYRCTFGKRKGRTVSDPSQCSKPVDLKKSFTMKKTKASKGAKMARKAQKTKRTNPVSKMARSLNK